MPTCRIEPLRPGMICLCMLLSSIGIKTKTTDTHLEEHMPDDPIDNPYDFDLPH